jgi:hypothetical protein
VHRRFAIHAHRRFEAGAERSGTSGGGDAPPSAALDAARPSRRRPLPALRCGRSCRRSAIRAARDLGRRNQAGRSFGERSGWLTRGQHRHRPARPVARSAEFPTGRMAINVQDRCNQLRPAPQQLDTKRFGEILVQDVRRGWIGPCPIHPAGEMRELRLDDASQVKAGATIPRDSGSGTQPPVRSPATCGRSMP